ncbi:aromatic acid exporter family protein [Desertibacillus haloalkaliphilus]|uniref:aromatic acid exporter family protein n=1 Tax=Desertibacillus haloalkaliphilus TaxID=1328930 RepID=UPI001C2719BE|nr:aromatic acid exporter family protein [Desertibacillus haloalkaliphilus]MBU8907770.1 aromatic acid exporter family protein [Desertibacillus haloalkaliphilus]
MFRIGYRTIKTAAGAAISIAIAQALALDFYVSAAIITILCISVTKRKSLKVSWERFLACTVGMLFGFVIFETIGYHPVALGILLLLFIPSMVFIKAKEGIVTSSVIILHIYTLEQINFAIVLNEIALITIGIGVALLMNLYMPSVEKDLKRDQERVEENFKVIFQELVNYLRDGDSDWDGKEVTETDVILKRAIGTSLRNIENHLLRNDDYYYHYFKMRQKQFEIIERVMPFISSLTDTVIQGEKIADFLEALSEGVHPGNTTIIFLERLARMKEEFKNMELPKDRQEFEIRSGLFYVMHELEQYLIIKSSLRSKRSG